MRAPLTLVWLAPAAIAAQTDALAGDAAGPGQGVPWALGGVALAVFLFLAVTARMKLRREAEARARESKSDAKRRMQNKIQLLFRGTSRIRSNLVAEEVDVKAYLQSMGFVANLENDEERFMASCKFFKPNLIVAGFEFNAAVERLVETDALLINTPVIYLHCGKIPPAPGKRVRAYLEPNADAKELSSVIAECLQRSPEKIRYSVKPIALKGDIQPGTLMDLLCFLAEVKKTGRLLSACGAARGEVQLAQGDIAKAGIGGLSGAEAMDAILSQTAGTFEFHERPKSEPAESGKADTVLNTQKILMDWAKKQDESDHHSRP